MCPPCSCSSSVLNKGVSGCVSVCTNTLTRETDLNFSQLAKIDTDGTLQHSAWAVLVWLRHICFVSVLLLGCFIVSLCRNLCCLAWQVFSRWVLGSVLRRPVPLGSVVWMCICTVTRVAQVPEMIDWNKSGSMEFVLEPSCAFYIFTAEVWRMPLRLYWVRSCFQHSPC